MIAVLMLACGFILPAQMVADVRQHDRWAREDAEYAAFVRAIQASESES